MELPSASDPKWRDIVTGKKKVSFDFLALNILVSSLNLETGKDSSPQAVQNAVDKLRDLFTKNMNLPKVQNDLKKIF